ALNNYKVDLNFEHNIDKYFKICQPEDLSVLILRKEIDNEDNLLIAEMRSKCPQHSIVENLEQAYEKLGLVVKDNGKNIFPDRRRDSTKFKPHLVIANIDDGGLELLKVIKNFPSTSDISIVLYKTGELIQHEIKAAQNAGADHILPLRYQGYYYQLFSKKVDKILNSISLKNTLNTAHKVIEEYGMGMITFLSRLTEIKQEFSEDHYANVANYALAFAQKMELPLEIQLEVYFSGLLHDLGKAHIPDDILLKPGKLNDQEWKIMKQHSAISKKILEKASIFKTEATNASLHHEFFNGKGTTGKKGEEIPLVSRIITIADAYDAMTNKRPYREPLDPQNAKAEIIRCAGQQFDKNIVDSGFIPWFEDGLPKPDLSKMTFCNKQEFNLFATDIKDTPILFINSSKKVIDEMYFDEYKNINIISTYAELESYLKKQQLPPQIIISGAYPDFKKLNKIKSKYYKTIPFTIIYHANKELSDEEELKLLNNSDFDIRIANNKMDYNYIHKIVFDSINDNFRKQTINRSVEFAKNMRQDLIKLLIELLKESELNIRGYDPEKVAYYAIEIAKEMGLSKKQLESIKLAALLGAIGQMFLADKIHKREEKKDSLEIRKIIVENSLYLLSSIPGFEDILNIILNLKNY
ncbi:HD domain-containing protein, partial [bacterium]|nr:HD domain-containing protein [bacterium]